MEASEQVQCASCGRSFLPRLSFQKADSEGNHYCSQRCRHDSAAAQVPCNTCGKAFEPTMAKHVHEAGTERRYYCSDVCRQAAMPKDEPAAAADMPPPRVIAVLNQKGGTGKTTTALHIAAGLARAGCKTLLLDLDPQGNIGVSLGVTSPRTIYHMLFSGVSPQLCAINGRENLDVVTSDEGLAAAEVQLARLDDRGRTHLLTDIMADVRGYEYVILDCAPALSVLNHNALTYADDVLIPVSCDYLALVGVRQVLRTIRRVGEATGNAPRIAGVLPTFYDVRNRVCADALSYLRKTFGPRMLPPVRVNVRLAEAPSLKKTIYEHAADSHGARDYIRVVEWLRNGEQQVTARAA